MKKEEYIKIINEKKSKLEYGMLRWDRTVKQGLLWDIITIRIVAYMMCILIMNEADKEYDYLQMMK